MRCASPASPIPGRSTVPYRAGREQADRHSAPPVSHPSRRLTDRVVKDLTALAPQSDRLFVSTFRWNPRLGTVSRFIVAWRTPVQFRGRTGCGKTQATDGKPSTASHARHATDGKIMRATRLRTFGPS